MVLKIVRKKLEQPTIRIIIFVYLSILQLIHRDSCDHTPLLGCQARHPRVFKSPNLQPIPTLPGTFGAELTEEFTSVLFSLCFGGGHIIQLINQTYRAGQL